MKNPFIITLFLLVAALSAQAVSRIGGGKIQSVRSGFEMNISGLFKIADIQNDSVRCLRPVSINQRGLTSSMGTQFFEISEFSNEFADATSLSAEKIVARFEKSGWKKISSPSCQVVMKLHTNGAIAYLATWGSGKGFVMKGTPTAQTEQVMREALTSLTISGGCSWK